MAERGWTFLVWMAGDNDLDPYALRDLAEIKKVGSSDEVAIVAQVDRFGDGGTRRYLLTRGGKLERDLVQELGETNAGDPAVATDFFTWGIETYPADRLCAVLWNHGSGIEEKRTRGLRGLPQRSLFAAHRGRGVRPRGIGYDDTSNDFLDNLELAQVLERVSSRTGRTLDLLGFDACLMSLLEIALQVQRHAKLLVSSQEVEPLDGWPYHALLADLVASPRMSAADLGRAIVRRYLESYKHDLVTLSLLDLQAASATTVAVDGLARALLAATDHDPRERLAVRAAAASAQAFRTRGFLDLGSLCDELRATTQTPAVSAACDAVQASLSGGSGLVLAESHRGLPVRRATGVSIYVPTIQLSVDYDRLALAQRSQWGKFVRSMSAWAPPSADSASSRPAAPRRRGRARGRVLRSPEPVRVLVVHGIGGVERDLAWQGQWTGLFRDGIGHYTPRPVEVDFLKLDDLFAAHPVTAADVAEALVKLGASGLLYGLKDVLTGARALAPLDVVRWTAGMVAQWASNESLRESTRGRLLDRVRTGPPVDLLAAHSLGSLVAYDTFGRRRNRDLLANSAVLTFGSQLGSPFVRGQFDGRIEPLAAAFWCHAYNPNDPVFTAPLSVAGEGFRQVIVAQDLPGKLADHDGCHYLAYPGVIDVGLRAAVADQRPGHHRATATRGVGPKAATRLADDRALIVGINDYPDPSMRLDGCRNDAYLMSEVLQELGIEARHVRLLLDRRATASAIRERIEWLLDHTRDGDTRVLVYSGHGAQVPGYGGGGEVDHLDECLVPWDFDWTPERSILDGWFAALYAQLPYAAKFVALFDCCHSGGLARSGAARVRGLGLPDDIRHRQIEWKAGEWVSRPISLPNATGVARWAEQGARVGESGNVRKLGRGLGLRWLPQGAGHTSTLRGRTRRAFGNKGPYMPLLLEACQEDELAYEHTVGTAVHGAFTYFLARTLRSFRAKGRPPSLDQVVKAAAVEVSTRYKQTPRLEGPTARRKERLA